MNCTISIVVPAYNAACELLYAPRFGMSSENAGMLEKAAMTAAGLDQSVAART